MNPYRQSTRIKNKSNDIQHHNENYWKLNWDFSIQSTHIVKAGSGQILFFDYPDYLAQLHYYGDQWRHLGILNNISVVTNGVTWAFWITLVWWLMASRADPESVT